MAAIYISLNILFAILISQISAHMTPNHRPAGLPAINATAGSLNGTITHNITVSTSSNQPYQLGSKTTGLGLSHAEKVGGTPDAHVQIEYHPLIQPEKKPALPLPGNLQEGSSNIYPVLEKESRDDSEDDATRSQAAEISSWGSVEIFGAIGLVVGIFLAVLAIYVNWKGQRNLQRTPSENSHV